MSEDVLCIKDIALAALGIAPGFTPFDPPLLAAVMARATHWVPRADAETNPEFRQLASYCMIVRPNEGIFSYRRAGQETRLDGRISVGIGGHVNRADAESRAGPDVIAWATCRELTEETDLPLVGRSIKFTGLINDVSDAVGRVHLGIASLAFAYSDVKHRESSRFDMCDGDHIATYWDQYESWSRIYLSGYLGFDPDRWRALRALGGV